MIKILIVDNELLAGVRIERLLKNMQSIIFIGQATSEVDAVAMLATKTPDIVLMKKVMPNIDGMSFSSMCSRATNSPIVIVCPILDQTDSLRQRDNLVDTLMSGCKAVYARRRAASSGERSHLYSYNYQGIDAIPIEHVRLLKADQKYVKVYTAEANFTISETLKNLEREFSDVFIRIHRNALVCINALQGIKRIDGCACALIRGIEVQPQISRRLEPKIRKLIAQL
jgi:two-component system response regulator AlgR